MITHILVIVKLLVVLIHLLIKACSESLTLHKKLTVFHTYKKSRSTTSRHKGSMPVLSTSKSNKPVKLVAGEMPGFVAACGEMENARKPSLLYL